MNYQRGSASARIHAQNELMSKSQEVNSRRPAPKVVRYDTPAVMSSKKVEYVRSAPGVPSVPNTRSVPSAGTPHAVPSESTQVLGPGALNTHFFDGKLQELSSLLDSDIQRIRKEYPPEKKYTLLVELRDSLRACGNSTVNTHRSFEIIFRDGQTPSGGGNYDPVNKLYADELLLLIAERVVLEKNTEYLELLATQLDEMATGMCSQGRTTRLLQVLVMLRKDLTPTSCTVVTCDDDVCTVVDEDTDAEDDTTQFIVFDPHTADDCEDEDGGITYGVTDDGDVPPSWKASS